MHTTVPYHVRSMVECTTAKVTQMNKLIQNYNCICPLLTISSFIFAFFWLDFERALHWQHYHCYFKSSNKSFKNKAKFLNSPFKYSNFYVMMVHEQSKPIDTLFILIQWI